MKGKIRKNSFMGISFEKLKKSLYIK